MTSLTNRFAAGVLVLGLCAGVAAQNDDAQFSFYDLDEYQQAAMTAAVNSGEIPVFDNITCIGDKMYVVFRGRPINPADPINPDGFYVYHSSGFLQIAAMVSDEGYTDSPAEWAAAMQVLAAKAQLLYAMQGCTVPNDNTAALDR